MHWSWLLMIAGGLLSTGHCLGMCGGFVTLLSLPEENAPSSSGRMGLSAFFRKQLVYHFGRISAYALLGFWAGFAGEQLLKYWPALRSPVLILTGLGLVILGSNSLGWLRPWFQANWKLFGFKNLLSRAGCQAAYAFANLLRNSRWEQVWIAGFLNGLIPCGMVYSYAGYAANSCQAGVGAGVMLLFGLGTLPGLLTAGLGVRHVPLSARIWLTRLAACGVLVLGAWSLVQGFRGEPQAAPCPYCQPQTASHP